MSKKPWQKQDKMVFNKLQRFPYCCPLMKPMEGVTSLHLMTGPAALTHYWNHKEDSHNLYTIHSCHSLHHSVNVISVNGYKLYPQCGHQATICWYNTTYNTVYLTKNELVFLILIDCTCVPRRLCPNSVQYSFLVPVHNIVRVTQAVGKTGWHTTVKLHSHKKCWEIDETLKNDKKDFPA